LIINVAIFGENMTVDDISELARKISELANPAIPLKIDLWGAKQIAAYLKVSPRHVLERYTLLPGFPTPIRLPSATGKRGNPRWKACEIISWAESYREKRPKQY
jgi:hypothetical protein